MREKGKHAQWRAALDGLLLHLFVAAGTAIGGTARAAVSIVVLKIAGPGLHWGTLTVNVTGCFVIGFFAALTSPGGRLFLSARTRQFVMTGLCGGFTTFSVFSLETFRFAAEPSGPRDRERPCGGIGACRQRGRLVEVLRRALPELMADMINRTTALP